MSLCGCVCLCMPVCRQWGTDAERCVLIFFIALGSSGGRRRAALMSRMCHCRTFSSEATARGDQNGMFILPTSPPSPHLCATLFLSLILLRCYIRWKVFYCHHAPPRTSSPRWNPGRYFMMGKKLRFYWGELNAVFTLKGAKILSERNLILCVFLNSAHPACPYLIDTVCCSCYPPFLIVRGWIDPDITCHILRTREYL